MAVPRAVSVIRRGLGDHESLPDKLVEDSDQPTVRVGASRRRGESRSECTCKETFILHLKSAGSCAWRLVALKIREWSWISAISSRGGKSRPGNTVLGTRAPAPIGTGSSATKTLVCPMGCVRRTGPRRGDEGEINDCAVARPPLWDRHMVVQSNSYLSLYMRQVQS
jgi:hypothetical protein